MLLDLIYVKLLLNKLYKSLKSKTLRNIWDISFQTMLLAMISILKQFLINFGLILLKKSISFIVLAIVLILSPKPFYIKKMKQLLLQK